MNRRTYVVHGRLAAREIRLAAARGQRHGVQVMAFEQLVARLAGGFAQPIDAEILRKVIQEVVPNIDLSELENIKLLPGMVGAAADTLRKVWRAGIDLSARAGEHPRLAALATLERAVLQGLPQAMRRPCDLAEQALAQLRHAPALFGEIDIVGVSEFSPCWRPLLLALPSVLPVRWQAGPRTVPSWLVASQVAIVRTEPTTPQVTAISTASAWHEAIEALRWARELIVSGAARPAEIAIAAATPADYDDAFLALRVDANFDLHFVHSIRVVSTREGQTAAALADVLARGLSQTRLRRLATLLVGAPSPFQDLPEGWQRVLPPDAPLTSQESWTRLLSSLQAADWPDRIDHTPQLAAIVDQLQRGTHLSAEIGQTFLSGAGRRIWNKALLAGSTAAIDVTIDELRQEDACEACVSVAWMPAAALAASPRRFVRLLGLTSTGWPRRIAEDRLLSDHIVPTAELDPLPVALADRRDFAAILYTTTDHIVLSRARRDGDGRLLGKSPLLRGQPTEAYIRRNRRPSHAMSETDRMLARPADFASSPQASAALACWHNWQRPAATAHDGLVRANHPRLVDVLGRVQSASSLARLLRDPLGFTWRYALGVRTTERADETLMLDARQTGILLHDTLDHAVRHLETATGFALAGADELIAAIDAATTLVSARWEAEQAVPPRVIWRRTLDDNRQTARQALQHDEPALTGQRCYTEVPFGGQEPKSDGALPWDVARPVTIPETGFRISGYIDRLDLSADGAVARVLDYKSGKLPKDDVILRGGAELQRCLYAFAVRALLGEAVTIHAALLYPRASETRRLAEPAAVLEALGDHLRAAHANLLAGCALIGPDNAGEYDDFAFALPANAGNGYCKRKREAAQAALGDATRVWEAV